MLRRAAQMAAAAAVAAGVILFGGGVAQAQAAGHCDWFPGSSDCRMDLTLCSHVHTSFLGGVKYAQGWGEVRIGSQWYTSASGCKITSWVTLTTADRAWDTPKKYSLCNSALTSRNSWAESPVVDTPTTATGAHAGG